MEQVNQTQLFRLAAVLYADNNYEVAPKTILKKVIESALLSNGNKQINIHNLIDFIQKSYNLQIGEQEVKEIIKREDGFLVNEKIDDLIVCLSEKRKSVLDSKLSKKTIDYFIDKFENENGSLAIGTNIKEVIYRFLYELLNSNIESFRKLFDNKSKIEDLINVESNTYSIIEREIINQFLSWDNNEKNKAVFDIASYALEYCMISNNKGGTHIQLSNLKNKEFYLDTNVIFRALGINGINRQNRTNTFLKKFIEVNTSLVISKFSELEFKDTINFYLDKLKKTPITRKINPSILNEKYFNSLSDVFDFYYKWRAGKYNDSLELFEGYILSLYEKFKKDFKIATDYKIPFDENEEKTQKIVNELSLNISSYKEKDGAKHGINGDNIDALNILLVEIKRDGRSSSIFETKHFIISTDQSLRRWDFYRNSLTPIVILPTQWLSILLRYINRSDDDFKSFVSFLNLPAGGPQIDSEKLHIILAGISEMTENFEQQSFIVQTLVQNKFNGILENGIKDDGILERTKIFVKTELEKKVDEFEKQSHSLRTELDSHKEYTAEEISKLKNQTIQQKKELAQMEIENKSLKQTAQILYEEKKIRDWKKPAYWLLPLIFILLLFFYFQLFNINWKYNYVQKLISYIDNNPSETKRDWMRGINVSLLTGIGALIVICYKRLFSSNQKEEKLRAIRENLPEEYK